MGCGNSKSLTDGLTRSTPPEGHRQSQAHPGEFLEFVHSHDTKEREFLLDEDCKKDEARVEEVGVGALVREALMRQKARMLMMQIIMKFQEALVVRRRLARAVFERWRFVVQCRKTGVDEGMWKPPSASRRTRQAMQSQMCEHHHDIILNDAHGAARNSVNMEMNYLRRIKEDDLMRIIETQRQEEEARGRKMDVRKLLASYGIGGGNHDHVCCKGNSCVIS